MTNLSLKQKVIGIIAIIGTILILIFQRGFSSEKSVKVLEKQPQTQSDKIQIVSTNPSPLDQSVLWAMQPIEINFDSPLENVPEFKFKIEPNFENKVELINNKQTVRITPTKPLPLGQTFTLFISTDTKFENKKVLEKEYVFHLQTIEYKGV